MLSDQLRHQRSGPSWPQFHPGGRQHRHERGDRFCPSGRRQLVCSHVQLQRRPRDHQCEPHASGHLGRLRAGGSLERNGLHHHQPSDDCESESQTGEAVPVVQTRTLISPTMATPERERALWVRGCFQRGNFGVLSPRSNGPQQEDIPLSDYIMKRFLSPLIVGLLTGFSTLMVHGQVSVSADIQAGPVTVQINSPSDFIQPLAAYGTWVDAPRYGRCWHPKDVSTDWQPYAYGQWVWTDAGWYWQSDEPWGWATCHYGSWTDDPSYGWLWIPGTQWAPAWVTWREGDNYIGWAPCGPNETVLPPSAFLFTGIHDFGRAFRGRGDF